MIWYDSDAIWYVPDVIWYDPNEIWRGPNTIPYDLLFPRTILWPNPQVAPIFRRGAHAGAYEAQDFTHLEERGAEKRA